MRDFGDHQEGAGRYEHQGSVNPADPSLANGGITPAQWAEYQAKRRRDLILGLLGVAGGSIGLGAAGAALGGAGAAGSAASGAGSAGSLAPISGGAPWAVTPYAGSATMAGTGAAGAGAAAGGAAAGGGLGGMFAGMSARDLASLGLGVTGAIGGAMSRPPDMSPSSATSDPQMQELLALMSGRLKKSEPLHDSVLAMANGLLPTQYQKGGGGMG